MNYYSTYCLLSVEEKIFYVIRLFINSMWGTIFWENLIFISDTVPYNDNDNESPILLNNCISFRTKNNSIIK